MENCELRKAWPENGLDVFQQIKIIMLGYEVQDEMTRQLQKWGEQNWPMYVRGIRDVLRQSEHLQMPATADRAKYLVEERAESGWLSYLDIFLEEVMEAVEEAREGNLDKLRAELVQVAAVALSMCAAIDRSQGK